MWPLITVDPSPSLLHRLQLLSGGYFTHTVPLTLRAFDLANTQVGLIPSLFSDNLALSGDPGSHPNEFSPISVCGWHFAGHDPLAIRRRVIRA